MVQPTAAPDAIEREAATLASLPDGSPVLLRAIGPGDGERLRRLFGRLSPATVYQRFFAAVAAPADRCLARLTALDGHDHYAAAALSGDEIVGVARYARSRPGSGEAEIAIVVEDAWQARGLGRLLLARLTDAARGRRIGAFTATALGDNRPIVKLVTGLFPDAELRLRAGEYRFRIRLDPPCAGPAAPAGSPAAGRGPLEGGRAVLPWQPSCLKPDPTARDDARTEEEERWPAATSSR